MNEPARPDSTTETRDGAPRPTSVACEVPRCIGLATSGPLCAAHRFAKEHPERLWTDENFARWDFEEFLENDVTHFRERRPQLSRYLVGVERVPMPMPALLDFQFHSPRATLLLAADLRRDHLRSCFYHQTAHLAQQVWRFRKPGRRGLVPAIELPNCDGRYAYWTDVDQMRERSDVRIEASKLATLVANSPSCPRCAQVPGHLEWFYFATPPDTWQTLSGFAGWMAICAACREQVALFIDRQN